MRSLSDILKLWSDPRMKETIRVLWREYYGLYIEKYNRSLSASRPWKRNTIDDTIETAQAIGQDIEIFAEQSMGIGIGHLIHSFRELQMGCYPLEDLEQTFDQWITTDRLITVGNGPDTDHRSDALILFKSGMLKLFSAVRIGAFPTDEFGNPIAVPELGTLHFTEEKGLELFENNAWNKVGDKTYHHIQSSPSRVWEAVHKLNKYPSVSIRDFDGNEYEAEVKHLGKNNTLLTFSVPFAGLADFN